MRNRIGFGEVGGGALRIGVGVLVLIVVALLVAWLGGKWANKEKRAGYREGLGQMAHFPPHNRHELRYFFAVSLSAGIVEEIIYRGFALWYFTAVMPLWAAVIVSSVGFGLLHIYLGRSGALRAGMLGLGFAIYYVLTGSIWLPILAHIALDLLQGLTAFEMLRDSDESRGTLEQ